MIRRIVPLVLAALVLAGCAAAPEPSASTPAPRFTSDADAFAAAEATYRAYVDALNQRRSDAASISDPQTFLAGQALEIDIRTQQELDRLGLTVRGRSEVISIMRQPPSEEGQYNLRVCLDSSSTTLTDSSGVDVTPTDRETRVALDAALQATASGMVIVSSHTAEVATC